MAREKKMRDHDFYLMWKNYLFNQLSNTHPIQLELIRNFQMGQAFFQEKGSGLSY